MSALAEESFNAVAALAPVRRAIGLGRLGRGALRGLGCGSLAGAVILGLNHLHPVSFALDIALVALIAGVIAGLVWAVRQWPGDLEAARAADNHFTLQDRLTTALELRIMPSPLAVLQRSDTARQVSGLRLAESRGPWFDWREVLAVALTVALFGVSLAIGMPAPRHARAAPPSDAARIHRATVRIPSLIHWINHDLTPEERHTMAIQRLQHALARLQRKLSHAQTRAAALRAISATQQQLHHIASTLHPISPHAVAQLNRALGVPHTGSHGSSPSNRAALAASTRALNRLANSLSHMSAAQRSALARTLAQAANKVSDKMLRTALHQAASSLAYNDPQTASAALQQAAAQLGQSPGSQTAQSQLSATSGQLDRLKGQVSGIEGAGGKGSGANGKPGGQGAGQGKNSGAGRPGGTAPTQGQGKGSGTGQGKGSGQGNGSGKGSGNGSGTGHGSGAGQGKGSGQGSGSGTGGSGGTGGHGAGGGRGGAGPRGHGRYTTVYAPQHQGKGPQTVQTGPNGQPLPGSFVPYHQVIQQYAASAHQALGRAALPPSLQSYVRHYFSTISH